MIYQISFLDLQGRAELKDRAWGSTMVELSDLIAVGSPVKVTPPRGKFLSQGNIVVPEGVNAFTVLRKPKDVYNVYDYIVQYYRYTPKT